MTILFRNFVFKPLSPDTQREIGRLVISDELDRLPATGLRPFRFCVAFESLVRRGIQKALGARPMKKLFRNSFGDAISQALKSDASSSGRSSFLPSLTFTIER